MAERAASRLLVGRDRQVRLRSSGEVVGAVHRVGRGWCAEPLSEGAWLQGRTRAEVLSRLADHLDGPPAAFAPGVRVTRTTRRGGDHPRTVLWRGEVVERLRRRVRVRWTEKDGARTVAVLDCLPSDLTIEETP